MTKEIFDRPAGRTLSDIIESMMETESVLFDNEGEITPELEEFMARDEKDLALKIDGYNAAYREESARAEALKAEIARLLALKKTAENSAKRIKEVLKYNMERLGAERVNGTTCKAYFSSSEAVEIPDESVLFKPYKDSIDDLKKTLPAWMTVEVTIGKKELGTVLKSGTAIKGASLQKNRSVVLK